MQKKEAPGLDVRGPPVNPKQTVNKAVSDSRKKALSSVRALPRYGQKGVLPPMGSISATLSFANTPAWGQSFGRRLLVPNLAGLLRLVSKSVFGF